MAPESISALKLWMKPRGIFLFYILGGCFVARNTLTHPALSTCKFLAPGNFSKYLALDIEVGVPHLYWWSSHSSFSFTVILMTMTIQLTFTSYFYHLDILITFWHKYSDSQYSTFCLALSFPTVPVGFLCLSGQCICYTWFVWLPVQMGHNNFNVQCQVVG